MGLREATMRNLHTRPPSDSVK
uniref:Uncharacterized protein n=1 Tax=Anguilla anguilla TaxID=7936 RepID=A0A0E9QBJ0_ANGAN